MRLIFLFFRKMRSRFFSARHLTGLLHARRNYQLGFIALGAGTAVVLNERVKGAVFSIYDVISKKSINFFRKFKNCFSGWGNFFLSLQIDLVTLVEFVDLWRHNLKNSKQAKSLPVYSREEISKHNTEESLWVHYQGRIQMINSHVKFLSFFFKFSESEKRQSLRCDRIRPVSPRW